MKALIGGSANLKFLKKFFGVLTSSALTHFNGMDEELPPTEGGGIDRQESPDLGEVSEGNEPETEESEVEENEPLEYTNESEEVEEAPEV